ncbi:MAG: CBS domain-containing protein, partial [Bacteroidales bacterium]|nr:CBS domain-containing protein [Bacteroidales bacterium]
MDTDYFSYLFCSINVPLTGEAGLFLLSGCVALIFVTRLSAAELAFFSLNHSELQTIRRSEHLLDRMIVKLLERAGKLQTALLLAVAFVDLLYVFFAACFWTSICELSFHPAFNVLIITLLISFPFLLVGKMIPKFSVAIHPLEIVYRNILTAQAVSRCFSLLVELQTRLQKSLLQKYPQQNRNISLDNLSQAIEMGGEEISSGKEMLKGIVKFGEKTVLSVMTARLDVAEIDIRRSFKELISFIRETGYSRIPVYSGTDDFIQGVLYIKDLLPYLDKPDDFQWKSLIRQAYFVPESKKITDLLEEFRQNKIHLAIVVDEFGGTSGIVTMEDILEEIVGDISD